MKEETGTEGSNVYSPEVLEFVRSANDLCSWLEDPGHESGKIFISESLPLLSKVYHHAVNLDQPEPVMEGGNEKFVTEQEWAAVFQRVLQLLGNHNEYLRVAESGEFDRSDVVTHKISEDLADLYQDLKDFTMQFRQGIEEIMNDTLWEVIDNFEQYWGEKLLNALHALNRLYVTRVDPGEEDGDSMDQGDPDGPAYDSSFFTRFQDQNEEEDI